MKEFSEIIEEYGMESVNDSAMDTYRLIVAFCMANGGGWPTMAEIGEGLVKLPGNGISSVSPGNVHVYVKRLRDMGLISKDKLFVTGGKWMVQDEEYTLSLIKGVVSPGKGDLVGSPPDV